jgi:adenosylmethionine-8-amino-7-oxononanoate aminotransferase
LTYPQCQLACADELERLVEREGADRIGAFIAEPVQGVGGVIVPPPGYFERIRAICDRHDILHRRRSHGSASKFGMHWGVPDMLVFAKGVTSGYRRSAE